MDLKDHVRAVLLLLELETDVQERIRDLEEKDIDAARREFEGALEEVKSSVTEAHVDAATKNIQQFIDRANSSGEYDAELIEEVLTTVVFFGGCKAGDLTLRAFIDHILEACPDARALFVEEIRKMGIRDINRFV